MKKIIVGNWKMKLGVRESIALARSVLYSVRGKEHVPEVIICPSFTALSEVRKVISRSRVELGAQNLFWEEKGAFTGEISARMLTELGCGYVIIGHSERRGQLQETDQQINKKVKLALQNSLTPILCVGENAEQRQGGKYLKAVLDQLEKDLDGVKLKRNQRLLIAYEPVWAIGTGRSAAPADAVEVHAKLKEKAAKMLGSADQIKVLYGGSVDKDNIYSFLREPLIEGALVGGASIKVSEVKEIINTAIEFNK